MGQALVDRSKTQEVAEKEEALLLQPADELAYKLVLRFWKRARPKLFDQRKEMILFSSDIGQEQLGSKDWVLHNQTAGTIEEQASNAMFRRRSVGFGSD